MPSALLSWLLPWLAGEFSARGPATPTGPTAAASLARCLAAARAAEGLPLRSRCGRRSTAAAAMEPGGSLGRSAGLRSSQGAWAKKQNLRSQPSPFLHRLVWYLRQAAGSSGHSL